MSESTSTEDAAVTIAQRLEIEKRLTLDEEPTFDSFLEIMSLSQRIKKECGIQLNLLRDNTLKTAYLIGNDHEVSVPGGFHNAWRVFFHTHWIGSKGRSEKSVLSMVPSFFPQKYSQFMMGDIGNTSFGIAGGGYLNIISPLGVSFMVGQEKHSKTAAITSVVREKLKAADTTSAPLLIVRSGPFSGEIIDDFSESVLKTDYLVNKDTLVFTVRIPYEGADFNLLFVKYDTLKELGISPRDIAFKKGVNTLVEELGVEIPHERNLYSSLTSSVQTATI